MKTYKFSISGNDYEVEILKMEGSHAEIEVNGTLYHVEVERRKVESKTPILVRSVIQNPEGSHEIKKADQPKSNLHQVKAPLPGTIMQIFVKPGDNVKRNDKLLVYEAMKMENNLVAEKEGTVKAVKVNTGDNVMQGDVLFEME
jgi:glutaconyl-CoA/methylmalonyl-CoA decarboxylase subunit gamma